MTTDLQRMHQDEWLGALRSGNYTQRTGSLGSDSDRCAIGVGYDVLGLSDNHIDYDPFRRALGISTPLALHIYRLNDGLRGPVEGSSFDAIADWFKAQRDLHDGDLSGWNE